MSAGTVHLTPQEAIARDRIVERVAAARSVHHQHHQHHERQRHDGARPLTRAAMLLRSLAERLDPTAERAAPALSRRTPAPHAGSPRPWTAAPRRAPHRHR